MSASFTRSYLLIADIHPAERCAPCHPVVNRSKELVSSLPTRTRSASTQVISDAIIVVACQALRHAARPWKSTMTSRADGTASDMSARPFARRVGTVGGRGISVRRSDGRDWWICMREGFSG